MRAVAPVEPTSAPAIGEQIYIVIEGNYRVAALRHVMKLMSNARSRRTRPGIRSSGSAWPQNG